ncbi:RNA polymerase subunit sigma-70 [Streptomyces sp. NBC_01433]|uniref:RNA polymerase subunit sigma-70 n=1 Tax=Streptomyces sp. NBC_01433 TaxID=2903864 RepID=UPI00224D95C5|nr:RNA polymerase subunit sigma-70 [Streptomyces sp. NBC_01433]MCX4675198.1 RNA polymerase subunit sigma-70 [Streptomyces sp. NBC_01433]
MTATAGECLACGREIEKTAGPGRAPAYCTQACRQRLYREREQTSALPVQELIADLGDRLRKLRPVTRDDAFHTDVEALSGPFTQLRRIARQTRADEREEERVTPEPVTNPTASFSSSAASDDVFATVTEQYGRELRVHCYRMLGSYDEAEDLTQETFLRAWRARDALSCVADPRAWLYKIATRLCLDFLREHDRHPTTYAPVPGVDSGVGPPPVRVTWLQPFPDDQLPDKPAPMHEPDAAAVASETLELAFLTAVQKLPARQRAAVLLRDVAGWSAQETADLLGSGTASANSAVQRGRAALRQALPGRREDWSLREPGSGEQALVRRFMDAMAHSDIDAMVELVREDAVLTMPPNPFWFTGRDALLTFLRPNLDPASPKFAGHWRTVPVRANGRMAMAGYLQRPGTSVYRAQIIDVLRIEAGEDRIAEITTFEPHLFPAFGLPMTL